MYCYKCSTQNEEIARFCRECDTQLKTDSFTITPYKKVVLVTCMINKLNVIKEIRMLTRTGLAEAKNVSGRTPSILKECISEAETKQIKNTITAISAVIEIS